MKNIFFEDLLSNPIFLCLPDCFVCFFLLFSIFFCFGIDAGVAVVAESNGHTENGDVQNGVNALETTHPMQLDKTNQDIVRLVGQHLKLMGLE